MFDHSCLASGSTLGPLYSLLHGLRNNLYSRAPLGVRLELHMKSHPFSASSLSPSFSHPLDVSREPFFNKSLRAEKIKLKFKCILKSTESFTYTI